MSNFAAVYPRSKAPFEIRNIDKHKPGPGEVLIKVYYAATNPVDWKIQKSGAFCNNFPTVLCSDVSGVIEDVGEGVNKEEFVGSKVWAFLPLLAKFDIRNGGFQQFAICPIFAVCKIPDNISIEEASTLGLAGCTAGTGLFRDLKLPMPSETTGNKEDVIVVWGASSAVGTFAVQFASLAGFPVFAVTSPKHFDMAKKEGATEVFDYNDPQIVSNIKQAGRGRIKWIFDAVCKDGSTKKSVEILDRQGKLLTTLPPPEDVNLEGIEHTVAAVAKIFKPELAEFRTWFFPWFNDNLAKGKVRPMEPEIVASGLQHAQQVIDYHAKGVSGKKPVLKIA